jgi:hypothetical protein
VKLTVFVASAPGFTNQHVGADAASRLLNDVMGMDLSIPRGILGFVARPYDARLSAEDWARAAMEAMASGGLSAVVLEP